MGEMADHTLQEIEDVESLRLDYRLGSIPDAEAYELGLVDELGAEFTPIRLKTCRYCGAEGLHWVIFKGGWRLASDAGAVHSCSSPANEQS